MASFSVKEIYIGTSNVGAYAICDSGQMKPPTVSYKHIFNSVTIVIFLVGSSPIFFCSFSFQILSSCHHLPFHICFFFPPPFYFCPSLLHPHSLFVFSVSTKSPLSIPTMHKKAKRYHCLLPTIPPLLLHAHLHLLTFVSQVLI